MGARGGVDGVLETLEDIANPVRSCVVGSPNLRQLLVRST